MNKLRKRFQEVMVSMRASYQAAYHAALTGVPPRDAIQRGLDAGARALRDDREQVQ